MCARLQELYDFMAASGARGGGGFFKYVQYWDLFLSIGPAVPGAVQQYWPLNTPASFVGPCCVCRARTAICQSDRPSRSRGGFVLIQPVLILTAARDEIVWGSRWRSRVPVLDGAGWQQPVRDQTHVLVLIQPTLSTPEREKTVFSIFLDRVHFMNSDLFPLGLSLSTPKGFSCTWLCCLYPVAFTHSVLMAKNFVWLVSEISGIQQQCLTR